MIKPDPHQPLGPQLTAEFNQPLEGQQAARSHRGNPLERDVERHVRGLLDKLTGVQRMAVVTRIYQDLIEDPISYPKE